MLFGYQGTAEDFVKVQKSYEFRLSEIAPENKSLYYTHIEGGV